MSRTDKFQTAPDKSPSHLAGDDNTSVSRNQTPAGKLGTLVSRQISMALSEWVAGINPPQDPPFTAGTSFPDSEWSHFFRIFSVATALSGAVFAGNLVAPELLGSVVPNGQSLKALVLFGFFGLVYSLYSRLFGVSIAFRQSLFCLALILTPWIPFYVLLKSLGATLGVVWLFLTVSLAIYVLTLVARAIHIVTGAHTFRVMLSLMFALLLAFTAILSRVGN